MRYYCTVNQFNDNYAAKEAILSHVAPLTRPKSLDAVFWEPEAPALQVSPRP